MQESPLLTSKLIKITDTTTGETREYIEDNWDSERAKEDNLFIWTEGNYACDCNRYLFFMRAGGIEPYDHEETIDHPCGETRYTVEIDGEVF